MDVGKEMELMPMWGPGIFAGLKANHQRYWFAPSVP
jgi:hypothetical protein